MAKLNVEKLNSRIDKVISSEEALKSIVPMEWSEDILTGNKQVLVTNISKDKENETCVSASFSYSKFTQSSVSLEEMYEKTMSKSRGKRSSLKIIYKCRTALIISTGNKAFMMMSYQEKPNITVTS